jgi:hypothetical protein
VRRCVGARRSRQLRWRRRMAAFSSRPTRGREMLVRRHASFARRTGLGSFLNQFLSLQGDDR